ncbi:MAG: SCO family protein, partial [Bacteroidota bacterium]
MMMRFLIIYSLFLTIAFLGCGDSPKVPQGPLPYLGESKILSSGETEYYQIPVFGFVDQDSSWVTNETVEDKIYVTDFFFTSCLSICPKMKQQMKRVYEAYQGDEEIVLLSHTIDPNYDSVAVLKEYAQDMDLQGNQWRFLTGEKDSIYAMGERYFVAANEDPNSQDGFYHTDVFTLMDKERRVRGVYHGTDSIEVKALIRDI